MAEVQTLYFYFGFDRFFNGIMAVTLGLIAIGICVSISLKIRLKFKLFGLFNIRINCSGSYWDNHVFDLSF